CAKQGILRIRELHRRVLDCNSSPADLDGIRSDVLQQFRIATEEAAFEHVVLNDHRAADLDIIKQALVIGAEPGACIPSPGSGEYGVEMREIAAHQVLSRK